MYPCRPHSLLSWLSRRALCCSVTAGCVPPALRAECTPAGGFLPENGLENYLDLGSVPLRSSLRGNPRSKSHRAQHLGHPLVVIAIAGRVESNEFRVSLLVDVEECLHMKTLHRLRCRHRRYEQIPDSWRIVFSGTAASPRPDSAPSARSFARADSAAGSRPRPAAAAGSRARSPAPRVTGSSSG